MCRCSCSCLMPNSGGACPRARDQVSDRTRSLKTWGSDLGFVSSRLNNVILFYWGWSKTGLTRLPTGGGEMWEGHYRCLIGRETSAYLHSHTTVDLWPVESRKGTDTSTQPMTCL